MTLRTLVRSIVAMSVFLALLTAAHLVPEPCQCGADDCCATESASTCDTPCCAGMVATTESMFRLDVPLGHTPTLEVVIPRHDFTPRDPLIRPPTAA